MAYWLFKSEPDTWSWQQQIDAGQKGTGWTGVRNHLANNNMRAMKNGDLGFFYHSNVGKGIVGIVEVCKEHYPDPTDDTARFGMVDIRAVKPLLNPVSLEQVKKNPSLKTMALVTHSRLSVQPVTDKEWDIVCKMGGVF